MFNNYDWGVTPEGYNRPTYDTILTAVEVEMKSLFGETAILKISSPLEIIARLCAWLMNIGFKLGEDVYNSGFVDTAEGNSLFSLGSIIGIRKLDAKKSQGYITVTGKAFTYVPSGFLIGTIEGVQFTVQQAGALNDKGTGKYPILATTVGVETNVLAEQITQIINPTIGIDSVINELPTAGGQDRETSSEFRQRYYDSVDYSGGVNVDAIRADILQNVNGVISCIVFDNKTDEPDAKGLVAHSVEAIVQGGVDEDIAKALFKKVSTGIETNGEVVVPVLTLSNQLLDIRFARPSPVLIYIKVEDLKVSGNFDLVNGPSQIKIALINYIGSELVAGELTIGEDLRYNRLPCRVLSVTGVIDFDLTISTDNSTYSKNNVDMTAIQKAITNEDIIFISTPEVESSGGVVID